MSDSPLDAAISERVKASLLAAPPAQVDWRDHDRDSFRLFLQSESGQRFIHIQRNNAWNAVMASVFSPPERLAESAGIAKGMQMGYQSVCQLAGTDPLKVVRHDGLSVSPTASGEQTGEESDDAPDEPALDILTNPGSSIHP